MKNINNFIIERGSAPIKSFNSKNKIWDGPAFKEVVKYSNIDYLKWKKSTKDNKNLMFGKIDGQPQYETIYLINHNEKMVEHIGTYNSKTEELYTDDINLFGNFV